VVLMPDVVTSSRLSWGIQFKFFLDDWSCHLVTFNPNMGKMDWGRLYNQRALWHCFLYLVTLGIPLWSKNDLFLDEFTHLGRLCNLFSI
jgi:hypothetical protein